MNIARITNRIALITVILMIYWVFIFVSTQVFGFRVFKENISQIFGMSILGIFAVLGGAIILNVMYNLTAIAETKAGIEQKVRPLNIKALLTGAIVSFVLIFGALYAGDAATSLKKKTRLINSAQSLVDEQIDVINGIAQYEFSEEYFLKVRSSIKLLSEIDESFPRVTAIITDEIEGKRVLLGLNGYYYGDFENKSPSDYILSTSAEERKYLYSVFDGTESNHRFSSNDGRYEIYFPVNTEKGTVVLHLSEFSRYGKIGS